MVRSGGSAASRWFCSTCTTTNPAETQQCGNTKCLLMRKHVGVDLPDDRRVADSPAQADVSIASAASRWFCSTCTTTNPAETQQCGNTKCLLMRKHVGVDLPDDRRAADAPAQADVSIASFRRLSRYRSESEPPAESAAPGKRKRCYECKGCMAKACGECANCLDMPKFGGKFVMRQPCVRRVCVRFEVENAEHAARLESARREKRARREARRAERLARAEENARKLKRRAAAKDAKEAEREAKLAEREERRAAKLAALEQREQATRERRLATAGARPAVMRFGNGALAELPVHPTEPSAYGWGAAGLADALVPGAAVEVLGVEEGLRGACFAARLVEAPAGGGGGGGGGGSGGGAWVEYADLYEAEDEGSAALVEWVKLEQLRLAPPPTPPGFLGLVRVGDRLQLSHEDCWWDMTLEEVSPEASPGQGGRGGGGARRAARRSGAAGSASAGGRGRPFRVSSVLYNAAHYARPSELRPLWLWGADDSVWRYELMAGKGHTPHAEPTCATFRFAAGLPRRHNVHFRSRISECQGARR